MVVDAGPKEQGRPLLGVDIVRDFRLIKNYPIKSSYLYKMEQRLNLDWLHYVSMVFCGTAYLTGYAGTLFAQ